MRNDECRMKRKQNPGCRRSALSLFSLSLFCIHHSSFRIHPSAFPREACVTRKTKGPLIIIGGREDIDESGKRVILREVTRCAGRGKRGMLIVTVATHLPDEIGADYVRAFKALGMDRVEVLDIRTRGQAFEPASLRKLDDACAVYFTGGDQLRITSQIGGT